MYFINDQCPRVNPVTANILYKVEPYSTESPKLLNTKILEMEQMEVLSKLARLMVKVHNKEVEFKGVIKVQKDSVMVVEGNDKAQTEKLITRLLVLNEKIDKLALERNIDISHVSVSDHLVEEQNNLCFLLENLNQRVNELVTIQKNSPKINVRMKNICIHADPSLPPLSIFMMLSHFRNNGLKVACIASSNSKLKKQPANYISNFINEKLCISNYKGEYELIVTIIWKEAIASDCILYDSIFNDDPLFGEMMCLIKLCSLMRVDISKMMPSIILINEQLHERYNSNTAMTSLNNKLHKEVNVNSDNNVAFGSFVVSSLIRSGENMGPKLKNAVKVLLDQFALNAEDLV